MRARESASAMKAWAQENNLISNDVPVNLNLSVDEKDLLFDSLRITSNSERILRSKQLISIGFNEAASKVIILTNKKVTIADKKILPEGFDETVSVEYIYGGYAHASVPNAGYPQAPYYLKNGYYACGSSIHPARIIGAGTLGCLVKDSANVVYGLTNNHVSGMCNYSLDGEKIIAPGHPDISASTIDPFTIGYHHQALPFVGGVPDNVNVLQNNDAALLRILDSTKVSSFQGSVYDTPLLTTALQANLDVEKVGRTTGHTAGTVIAEMAGSFSVSYALPTGGQMSAFFEPVFLVRSMTGNFSEPGDSGSLVTTVLNGVRHAVGLVFAGDNNGNSYLLPIEPILANLNVTLLNGHNI